MWIINLPNYKSFVDGVIFVIQIESKVTKLVTLYVWLDATQVCDRHHILCVYWSSPHFYFFVDQC